MPVAAFAIKCNDLFLLSLLSQSNVMHEVIQFDCESSESRNRSLHLIAKVETGLRERKSENRFGAGLTEG